MAMKPVDREPIVIRSVSPRTPVLRNSDTPRYSVRFDPLRLDSTQRSLPFLLQDRLHGFPGLFTDSSEHVTRFLLFLFSTFCSFGFRAVD